MAETGEKQQSATPDVASIDAPASIKAPALPYRPRDPEKYRPGIGLIGCGGIASWHLKAYRDAGYRVVAFCDVERARAVERRDEFFPAADVHADFQELLRHDDVEVVDVATHPLERPPIIEAAVRADKHVLSQKPFVLDLDVGQRLADLADQRGVMLAVNQNARWAPHFSYMRAAVAAGLLGELSAVHCAVHWDHSWVQGTAFEEVRHLILYDFAVHWFDMLSCLMGARKPKRVYASFTPSATQTVRPALMAQAAIEYAGAQASLVFDGHTRWGRWDSTFISGSAGTIRSDGASYESQQLVLQTDAGIAQPELIGTWFPDGFHGAMGELLTAIEEERQPTHSARQNLATLELCFAAVASAEQGQPIEPGSVRRMP